MLLCGALGRSQYLEDQVMDSSAIQSAFGAGLDATVARYGKWLAAQQHKSS